MASASSSYIALPPVWDKWTYEDVNPLSVEDLGRLHMIVWKKLEFIEDQIENKALFESRNINIRREKNKKEEEGV
jgi:hypothetical protein